MLDFNALEAGNEVLKDPSSSPGPSSGGPHSGPEARASTRKEISFQKDILAFGRKNKRKCDLEGNWEEIRPFGRKREGNSTI